MPNLIDINNTSLDVAGGGNLTLPGVMSYSNSYDYLFNNSLKVVDTDSGGTLDLPNLQTISGAQPTLVAASGPLSQIDLPALTSFSTAYSYYGVPSSLSVTQGATVADGSLNSLTDVNVTLDGTGTLAITQWMTLTEGSLAITGGDYAPDHGTATPSNSFTNLSGIDGSALLVSGGGSLSLPSVTGYLAAGDPYVFSQYGDVFEATGANSTLGLPGLISISGDDTSSYADAASRLTRKQAGKSVSPCCHQLTPPVITLRSALNPTARAAWSPCRHSRPTMWLTTTSSTARSSRSRTTARSS